MNRRRCLLMGRLPRCETYSAGLRKAYGAARPPGCTLCSRTSNKGV